MTFGEKLQQLRKSKGMSQEELAAQITVSRQAVSKWELNDSLPDIENVLQISTVFGVSTDYLLKDENDAKTAAVSPGTSVDNSVAVNILDIASVALIAIGLICGFSGWHDQQTADAIGGSMIIQAVGVVAYFISRVLSRNSIPLFVSMVNVALVTFMPISMLSCLISGYQPYAPYVPFAIKKPLFIFFLTYVAVIVISFLLLRKYKRYTKK